MNSFIQAIMPQLEQEGVSADRFSELLLRLMDYGVLCRDESQTEQQYYDVYVRIETLVSDYFECLGVRCLHEKRFQYVRLIPPGARIPGMDDEQDVPFNGGLRNRLTQNDVALILVLRAEYDKALGEGQIDELGCVRLSMEALAIALKNILQRQLPDNVTERRTLFRRLRQLRLLDYAGEDAIEQPEAWLKIRPMIVSFVSDDVLDSLRVDIDESIGRIESTELAEAGDEGNLDADVSLAADGFLSADGSSLFARDSNETKPDKNKEQD